MFDLTTIDPKLLRKQYRYLLALEAKAQTAEARRLLQGVISILEALMLEVDAGPPRKSLTLRIGKE